MVPGNGRTDMMEKWLERIEDKVDTLICDVSVLKVKAGLYGGVVALIVSAVVVAVARAVFK